MSHQLWNIINELQSEKYEWVDLSHSLNNDSPYWAVYLKGRWSCPRQYLTGAILYLNA